MNEMDIGAGAEGLALISYSLCTIIRSSITTYIYLLYTPQA